MEGLLCPKFCLFDTASERMDKKNGNIKKGEFRIQQEKSLR